MDADKLTDAEAEGLAKIPDPTACRRPDATKGLRVVMGDGRTWELPRVGLRSLTRGLREEFYVDLTLRTTVRIDRVLGVAYLLLGLNYDLPGEALRDLVLATDPASISGAVVEATLPAWPSRRDFTSWARASLIANGIRPESVDPADLPHVLAILEATGRTVPVDDYTEAGQAATKRAGLLAQCASRGESGTADAE